MKTQQFACGQCNSVFFFPSTIQLRDAKFWLHLYPSCPSCRIYWVTSCLQWGPVPTDFSHDASCWSEHPGFSCSSPLRSTCPSQASKIAMPERSCGDDMKPQSATVKVKTMRCRSQKLGLNIYRCTALFAYLDGMQRTFFAGCQSKFTLANARGWTHIRALKYFERTVGFLVGHSKR